MDSQGFGEYHCRPIAYTQFIVFIRPLTFKQLCNFIFTNLIVVNCVVHSKCDIFVWFLGSTVNTKTTRSVLMAWCFSTRHRHPQCLLSTHSTSLGVHLIISSNDTTTVASSTREVNPRLAKRPLVFNGRLANRGLTSLVKEATFGRMTQVRGPIRHR